jgi:hypothetical protein
MAKILKIMAIIYFMSVTTDGKPLTLTGQSPISYIESSEANAFGTLFLFCIDKSKAILCHKKIFFIFACRFDFSPSPVPLLLGAYIRSDRMVMDI